MSQNATPGRAPAAPPGCRLRAAAAFRVGKLLPQVPEDRVGFGGARSRRPAGPGSCRAGSSFRELRRPAPPPCRRRRLEFVVRADLGERDTNLHVLNDLGFVDPKSFRISTWALQIPQGRASCRCCRSRIKPGRNCGVDLLIVGHVTRDEMADGVQLGGAAAYAALAASRLGYHTRLVTVAPPDDPLLSAAAAGEPADSPLRPGRRMTTFALDYTGPARADAATSGTRVTHCRRSHRLAAPSVAYVGLVAGECDAALVGALDARFVGAGSRLAAARGRRRPRRARGPRRAAAPGCGRRVGGGPPAGRRHRVAARRRRGNRRNHAWRVRRDAGSLPYGRLGVAAVPTREVDPTGAGDVFGVVLTLQLAAGARPADAARAAAEAAARIIEGPLLGSF